MQRRLLLHLIFWTAYIIEDTVLEYAWIRSSFLNMPGWKRALMALHSDLVLLPPKLLFVYFIIFISIEKGLRRNRKLLRLVFEMMGILLISILIHRAIVYYYTGPVVYNEPWEDASLLDPKRMLTALLDIGFVAGGAVAMKLFMMFMQGKEREKNLAREKLEAELKFLRTQTNPHFLFNTLNNIYALARKKSEDTADVVMKLSTLLRFMLYESRKDRIPLSDEIRMIEDYLELEKIRYNERLTIQFNKNIDDPSRMIAPLILLPFIENAFKHGASETRFDSYINIEIKLNNGHLYFKIKNSKEDEGEQPVKENIGLTNVRRQLELMYKEYQLRINNIKNEFHIQLFINLNQHASV